MLMFNCQGITNEVPNPTAEDFDNWRRILEADRRSTPSIIKNMERSYWLYHGIRFGDEVAVKAAAEQCFYFGLSVVKGWRKHDKFQDIIGEMQLMVMQCVRDIRRGSIDHHPDPKNPLPYISGTISPGVVQFLASDHILGIHPATYRRHGGRPFSVFSVQDRDIRQYAVDANLKAVDLKDEIRKLFQELDDRERLILEGRAAGSTDKQIGESFDPPLTKMRIHQIRVAACQKIQLRMKLNQMR